MLLECVFRSEAKHGGAEAEADIQPWAYCQEATYIFAAFEPAL
jgi:hypothetical protein